ncbi:ankyrin repeat domain-containing protein [Streptomyces sp. NPDC058439]|uniref:ankyrin repeat domain-containing protein n=1 Tax=Streptomyces sp. NPDC058439 TaxID=3346500 RepID=UPI0036552513
MNRRQQKLSKRLAAAATFGDSTQINALLRAGACPEASITEGTTPLYAASVNGAADNVLCLLAAGSLPNTESGRGAEGTPLCAAACWGHTEAVRALLTHGADPNLRGDHGMGHSPLEWATTGRFGRRRTTNRPVPHHTPGTTALRHAHLRRHIKH